MIKREFYFLQDGASLLFYTGQGNVRDSFRKAAVYYSYESASKKRKDIVLVWEHDEKYQYTEAEKEEIRLRKSKENWGVLIRREDVAINNETCN